MVTRPSVKLNVMAAGGVKAVLADLEIAVGVNTGSVATERLLDCEGLFMLTKKSSRCGQTYRSLNASRKFKFADICLRSQYLAIWSSIGTIIAPF
jgi:hypothetical protein